MASGNTQSEQLYAACLQCDTNIKSQVPHTERNVEWHKAGHLTSLHFRMCGIRTRPKREKMKAQSKESRNDLCWL